MQPSQSQQPGRRTPVPDEAGPSANAGNGVLVQRLPGWTRQVWIVLHKDLLIELATGEVVTTSAFFAVLVVVASSLSFYGGPEGGRWVAAGVIWISVAFATILALGRSWQHERDEGALEGLVAAPLSPSAVFAAKTAGLIIFLGIVEVVVLPITALFYSIDVGESGLGLVVVAVAATPGIAASGSLFGAMTVRTRARDLMLAIVLFPLLAPTLMAAIAGTRQLLVGDSIAEIGDYLKIMLLFDAVLGLLGGMLFGVLVND